MQHVVCCMLHGVACCRSYFMCCTGARLQQQLRFSRVCLEFDTGTVQQRHKSRRRHLHQHRFGRENDISRRHLLVPRRFPPSLARACMASVQRHAGSVGTEWTGACERHRRTAADAADSLGMRTAIPASQTALSANFLKKQLMIRHGLDRETKHARLHVDRMVVGDALGHTRGSLGTRGRQWQSTSFRWVRLTAPHNRRGQSSCSHRTRSREGRLPRRTPCTRSRVCLPPPVRRLCCPRTDRPSLGLPSQLSFAPPEHRCQPRQSRRLRAWRGSAMLLCHFSACTR